MFSERNKPVSRSRAGFTLIEVVMASVILAIAVLGLMQIQNFMSKQSVTISEKTFANQKAIQMLEELRSLVSGSESTDLSVLDDFDDGAVYKNILTTNTSVTSPDSPESGNVNGQCGDSWKYLRQISVIKLPEEPFSRRVYARVYKASCSNPNQPGETLAEAMTILKTIKSQFVPTQVMDVFILAIENVAGWWSSISDMRPTFDSVMQDLQNRNPGLEIRTHWVTRLSYGRDQYYMPYINDAARTNVSPSPLVYLYPGKTQQSDGSDYDFYVWDKINGRINVDGERKNEDNYALADQFNHSMREPDEEDAYALAVASAAAIGQPAPELSWRLLLERLNQADTPYRNILLVNLHGELLPLPPMHNYSDAAKDPVNSPNRRVVTHPERILYTSTDTVKLRVYAYVTDQAVCTADPSAALNDITLQLSTSVPLVNLLTAQRIDGDANNNYEINDRKGDGLTGAVRYDATSSTCTVIRLTNGTKLCSGLRSTKGLASSAQLYGMEYIPCPIGADFTADLTTTGTTPKNTARWIISLAPPAGGWTPGRWDVDTYIGPSASSGTVYSNVSRTHVWISTTVPITEQYQLTGDARYCPYMDVKANNGYNWYFADPDSIDSSYNGNAAYTNFSKGANGWGETANDIDVPRYMYIVRNGLLNSHAVWTTMNGWSYYYHGFGGEFGSDMQPLPNAVPYIVTPWSATRNVTDVYGVNEIVNYCGASSNKVNSRLVATTDNAWHCSPWLGELYPDTDYSVWGDTSAAPGNLPTNLNLRTGVPNYYRATHTANAAWKLGRVREFRLQSKGCETFFNGKPASQNGPFEHVSVTGNGTITSLASDVGSMFNFPLLSSINTPRPFTLNYNNNFPNEWSDTTYSGTLRTTIDIPSIGSVARKYYTYDSSYDSSAIVRMTNAAGTAFVVVSGMGTQSDFGTSQLGKYMIMLLLRSFMDGGLYTGDSKITQVPVVSISSPTVADTFTDPMTINVGWNTSWTRWDGQPYTTEYSSGYADSETLMYHVKYSTNNGRTWKFCSDNTATTAGARDSAHLTALTSYVWTVAALERGSYILRVEAFRGNVNLHYAYHQMQVYIYR
ncbi:MAG: prepilin-type N-terminal cleavage/methylation domain-containing protein [Elusimicrobiales bacterium]